MDIRKKTLKAKNLKTQGCNWKLKLKPKTSALFCKMGKPKDIAWGQVDIDPKNETFLFCIKDIGIAGFWNGIPSLFRYRPALEYRPVTDFYGIPAEGY